MFYENWVGGCQYSRPVYVSPSFDIIGFIPNESREIRGLFAANATTTRGEEERTLGRRVVAKISRILNFRTKKVKILSPLYGE